MEEKNKIEPDKCILNETYDLYGKYLTKLTIKEGYTVLEFIFPKHWKINIKDIEQTSNTNNDSLLYVAAIKNYSNNFTYFEENFMSEINKNIINDEKSKLLNVKIMELKELFNSADIESLKKLNFKGD